METVTIYLAGPIDDVPHELAIGWRDEVARMAPIGCLLFDPVRAWRGASIVTAAAVVHGDKVNIAHSDGVLAYLAGPGRAFGTVREIEFARDMNKPVAVVSEEPLASFFAYDIQVADSLSGALHVLLEEISKQRNLPQGMMILRIGQGEVSEDNEE